MKLSDSDKTKNLDYPSFLGRVGRSLWLCLFKTVFSFTRKLYFYPCSRDRKFECEIDFFHCPEGNMEGYCSVLFIILPQGEKPDARTKSEHCRICWKVYSRVSVYIVSWFIWRPTASLVMIQISSPRNLNPRCYKDARFPGGIFRNFGEKGEGKNGCFLIDFYIEPQVQKCQLPN